MKDLDNLIALLLIGAIAILAIYNDVGTNQLASIALGGIIGYISKGINLTKKENTDITGTDDA